MLVFGLTGNIGSGKSTVGGLLAEAGVPVIDADRIAREVVEPGTPALAEIAARFPGVVVEGRLDRKALAARVFADAGERAALNRIVHPRIALEVMRRLAQLRREGQALAVYEAALIVEQGLHQGQAGLIVVTAPEELQLERVCARDGAAAHEVRARLAAQLPQAEKVKAARFVIENHGTREELRRKVDALLVELRALAAGGTPERAPHG